MKKIILILFTAFLSLGIAQAADLPSKGKTPPALPTTRGPGDYPGDPGAPIESGLALLIGFSATYILVKRKKKNL